jgi:hypothetical protein
MLPHIDSGIPNQKSYGQQGPDSFPKKIDQEEGRPEDIGGVVGGKRIGTGTGPEEVHLRQNIAGPGAGKKVFKEKTIGIIQQAYQKGQQDQTDFHFPISPDKQDHPGAQEKPFPMVKLGNQGHQPVQERIPVVLIDPIKQPGIEVEEFVHIQKLVQFSNLIGRGNQVET